MSKIREKFSPSLCLLDVLLKTLKGSAPSIDRSVNCGSIGLCHKARGEVNLCVDAKDDMTMIAVCNSQEGCARTAIIYPQATISNYALTRKIIASLKRSGLGNSDIGFAGACAKSLEAAKVAASRMTTINIDTVNNPRVHERRCSVTNTTVVPVPMTGKGRDFTPTIKHIVRRIADKVEGIREIEMIGASGLCENANVLEQDQVCLKVLNGTVTLALCSHKNQTSYLLKAHHLEGTSPEALRQSLFVMIPQIISGLGVNEVGEIACTAASRQAASAAAKKAALAAEPEEEHGIFSKRFPEPFDWSDKPDIEEVYRAILMIQGSSRSFIEEDGTFVLDSLVQSLTTARRSLGKDDKMWWKPGWDKLCDITPKIVEHDRNGKGMRIHCIRLASNCLAAMDIPSSVKTEDRLTLPKAVDIALRPSPATTSPKDFADPAQTDSDPEVVDPNSNAPKGEEETSMAKVEYSEMPAGEKLAPKEKEMVRELLKLATDKNSAMVAIPDFTDALLASPYSGKSSGAISVTASSLRAKGIALPVDRSNQEKKGVIEILRLHPDELKVEEKTATPAKKTTKKAAGFVGKKKAVKKTAIKKRKVAKKKTTKKAAKKTGEAEASAASPDNTGGNKELCSANQEGCCEKCTDKGILNADGLTTLLGGKLNGGFDPQELIDALVSDRSEEGQRTIYRLVRLSKGLESHEKLPEFTTSEDGVVSVILS